MAVCKTGHKVLFSSQINTKEFHVSLLEQTDCRYFFSGLGVHVDDILAARQMRHVVIPDLEDLLDPTKAPHYPYEKTFEEAKNDPYVVLHTSGTTGTAVRIPFFEPQNSTTVVFSADTFHNDRDPLYGTTPS